MSNRSYPSGAAKKKLKKLHETESLTNVPNLTSFGFRSKSKEIEGKDGEGIKEDICDLPTEGQNQTISTLETITDVSDKEKDRLELESSCKETRESRSKGNVYESLLVSPFSNHSQ